jgi:hypothetical protein
MELTRITPAELDEQELSDLRALENELGITIVGYETTQTRLAQLDSQQLERLQAAERKLGMVLMAFDRS